MLLTFNFISVSALALKQALQKFYFCLSNLFLTFTPQDSLLSLVIQYHFQFASMNQFPAGNPAGNYIFKVNNRNTRTRCEICSKLTIKTPERHHMGSLRCSIHLSRCIHWRSKFSEPSVHYCFEGIAVPKTFENFLVKQSWLSRF